MSEQKYELAFYGKLMAGSDLQQTKEQIALLFKTNLDQVERMFTGSRVVIRNKLDAETARKYLLALQKRGANCQIEMMGEPGVAVSPDQPDARLPAQSSAVPTLDQNKPAAKPASKKPGLSVNGLPIVGERVDEILSDRHFDLAPVGARLEDKKPEVVLDLHALDDITLAPVGSELLEHKEKLPVPVPDTSHLQLAQEDK